MIYAIHGNLGSPDDWCALELPDLVKLDLWDTPGAPSLEEWGIRCASMAADSGSPDPVLLGYSMGGRLALHAMIAAPEVWKGAVIVSAHPGLVDAEARRTRLSDDREWASAARTTDWRTFLEIWNAQGVLAGCPPPASQVQLEPHRESIARAFENWSLGHQPHLGARLSACRFPILWVTGERDEKFTSLAADLSGILPDFEHVIIPNCGHRVIFEKPAALSAAIRDFQKRRL